MSQHTRAHIDQDVWAEWIAYNAATGALDGDILSELLAAGVDPERAAVWISEVRGHPIFKAAQAVQSDAQKLIDINDVLVQLEGIQSTRGALERVSNISAEGFLKQFYSTNTPVILTDIAAHWPAIGKWNLEYLDKHFGQHEITYQYRELDGDHRNALFNNQRRSPLSEYITNIADNQNSRNYYLVAQDRLLKRMAFRPLLDDIILDHPIFDTSSAKKHLSLWMGPKGSVTPMHRDRCNVFFVQILGRKIVKLISPKYSDKVYHREGFHSEVDFESVDYNLYPKLAGVRIIEAEIRPGELLFIPVAWWHHVKALDISITVTGSGFAFPNRFGSLSKYYE